MDEQFFYGSAGEVAPALVRLDRTASVIHASTVHAVTRRLHPAVLGHGFTQGFAGSVQANGRVVGRNAELFGCLLDTVVSEIHEIQDFGIVRSEGLSEMAAACAALWFLRFTVLLSPEFGRGHHSRSARLGPHPVDNEIAMNAVQPGQDFFGILQGARPLHGPHRSGLEGVLRTGVGNPRPNKCPKLALVLFEGISDDFEELFIWLLHRHARAMIVAYFFRQPQLGGHSQASPQEQVSPQQHWPSGILVPQLQVSQALQGHFLDSDMVFWHLQLHLGAGFT